MINWIISAVLVVIIVIMLIKWPKMVELSDDAPKEDSPKNRWLQLQNEGGKYVKLEDGKVKIKIVK